MTTLIGAITDLSISLDILWILLGIVLVFFMQAGFAMVETGFTRAKNAGNIIMKNIIDFSVGTIVFILLGYGLMHGTSLGGIVGVPINPFIGFDNGIDWVHVMFNLVFCATAATIVSGAMAERTKFSSYCMYGLIISLFVYPISGHWIWGDGGWLAELGFIDFAGSTAVHMVGGVAALVGAKILGPRIGKYKKLPDGTLEAKAIPGHSLTLGALGVLILWFGWYGFNGASTYGIVGMTEEISKVFITTTIAAAVATVATMIITWVRYKKPDVSMTLNGALAGLVAITAGTAEVTAVGAFFIGLIAAFVVVFGIEFIDKKMHIDDPVGAIGVHGLCGAVGTILVGVFSRNTGIISGFIYNDSLTAAEAFKGLGVQTLGVAAVAIWTALIMLGVFFAIKKTVGLRVTKEEEIKGLDSTEHGLINSYADFMPVAVASTFTGTEEVTKEEFDAVMPATIDEAIPVKKVTSSVSGKAKMSQIVILANPAKFEDLKTAMDKIGITGMTVTNVTGCGLQKGSTTDFYRGVKVDIHLLPKIKLELVVSKIPVQKVIDAAKLALYTGNYGDGKIFVYDVEHVVKIRTGETDFEALQDEC